MKTLSYSEGPVRLDSNNNTHKILLNDEHNRIVPENHDVIGIDLRVLEHLDTLRIWMGGQLVATFDKHTFPNLTNFPLYLTKSYYYYTHIEFVFDKKWLLDREEFEMVDEYREVEEYGDMEEVFDGYEYHIGQVVMRRKILTGNTVKRITGKVEVEVPTLQFKLIPAERGGPDTTIVPIRERVYLPNYDDDTKEVMASKHDLEILDGTTGYITNYIRYCKGLAGLQYSW